MPINTQTPPEGVLNNLSSNLGGVNTLRTPTGMDVAEIVSNPLEFLTKKISQGAHISQRLKNESRDGNMVYFLRVSYEEREIDINLIFPKNRENPITLEYGYKQGMTISANHPFLKVCKDIISFPVYLTQADGTVVLPVSQIN